MGIFGWLKRVGAAILRLPLRGIDWLKVKLGYVSVPQLREFVYLDESSVISLIASTTGGVTEQKSTVKRRQISGSIGGLGNGGGALSATKEKSTEAVRRYVIQSNFKELYEMRADELVISDEYEPTKSVPRRAWERVVPQGGDESVKEDIELKRGDLSEINVNLGSHEIYEYYTAIESIGGMFESAPEEAVQKIDSTDFSMEQLEAFSELFEHLLADLVPIVGEASNYGVVEGGEGAQIVRKDDPKYDDVDDLNIVGFVNSEKFWTEETRFLFEKDEYTVFCRMDSDEITQEWMPIKLVSVVNSIIPDLGESVHEIPNAFDDQDSAVDVDRSEVSLRPRLESFLESVEEETDIDIDSAGKEEVVQATLDAEGRTTTRIEGIEVAIERLEEELTEREYQYNLPDPDRESLLDEMLKADFDEVSQSSTGKEWYLEVSFTAIYW